MKTVYVTGATGFLGATIVQELLRDGEYMVHAMYRSEEKAQLLTKIADKLGNAKCLHLVKGDVTDYKSMVTGIPEHCDTIFHVAAYVSLHNSQDQHQYNVNVLGTANLCEAALTRKAKRIVLTSSIATYGGAIPHSFYKSVWLGDDDKHTVINEFSDQCGPLNDSSYARTKYLSEVMVRDAAQRSQGTLEYVILNPGFILGRYDYDNMGKMVEVVMRGKSLEVGTGSAPFVYSVDVARAHIEASKQKIKSSSQYILGGLHYKWDEVITEMLRNSNDEKIREKKPTLVSTTMLIFVASLMQLRGYFTGKHSPLSVDFAYILGSNAKFDSSKATLDLGFDPQPLSVMIKDTADWIKSNYQV